VPLKAVAAIGGIIELDARLRNFAGGLSQGSSLEQLAFNFGRYEEIVQRVNDGLERFTTTGDKIALIQLLLDIRADLISKFPSVAERIGEA